MKDANTKIRILCAEDEPDISDNIAEILRDEGFEVLQAKNGREALEMFLEHHPDIIVSDIMMPELSGYDLLKVIRENKTIRDNNVPFIFLTALNQKENIMKGISLSANDYLVKPIDFELLIAKIKEKTNNAIKVRQVFDKNIDNLKVQVSSMVPKELSQYVDAINQIAAALKNEPYGPLPHKKYLDDINKVYINSVKLKSVIDNILSGGVITNQLDAKDEISDPTALIEGFVNSLNEKFRSKIKIESGSKDSLPKIKVEQTVILDAIRRIFSGLFKTDPNSELEISFILDHLNQLAFIFHVTSKVDEAALRTNLDIDAINKVLEKQGCNVEMVFKAEASILLYIPTYRVEQ